MGGLLLTRGGSTRAPAPLTRPGNIQGGGIDSDWTQRFSDYYVKGQTSKSVQRAVQEPLMTFVTDPTDGSTFPIETTTTATQTETVSFTDHGVARDTGNLIKGRPDHRGYVYGYQATAARSLPADHEQAH